MRPLEMLRNLTPQQHHMKSNWLWIYPNIAIPRPSNFHMRVVGEGGCFGCCVRPRGHVCVCYSTSEERNMRLLKSGGNGNLNPSGGVDRLGFCFNWHHPEFSSHALSITWIFRQRADSGIWDPHGHYFSCRLYIFIIVDGVLNSIGGP